jgi:hypothetical protein
MENVHIVGIVQQWDQDKFKRSIINAVEGEVALLTGTGPTVFHPDFHGILYPGNLLCQADNSETGFC